MINNSKNSRQIFILLCLFSATFFSCSNDEKQTVITKTDLVFEDNFSIDGSLNPSVWNYEIGRGPGNDGWGNNELQYYTDRPENIIIEDGMLKITAIKEMYLGAPYTSARITTKGKYEKQYGRFEARMKLPSGKGLWPAFWMMGNNIDTDNWPQCGEIDILENKGSEPTIISSAIHGPGYSGGNAVLKSYTFKDSRVDTEFHIYGIEWGPSYINFYVDNVLYNQLTPESPTITGEYVFDSSPFFMLINLAVGGNFDGNPTNATAFPQTLLVDYVRVYQ